MTIAIAIQTLSAIVFATDSKLTTYGRAGYDDKGEPVVVPQTYDNATKVVSDPQKLGMVAVTGGATLGSISFMDYVASHVLPTLDDAAAQLVQLEAYAKDID